MSCLLIRQPQTWRGAHAAITTLCRLRWLLRPGIATTIRLKSTTTATSSSKFFPPIRRRNSAILIPASVEDTQPDDLINLIEPVQSEHANREPFCVFLVTPSFASWLLKEEDFLAKAVRQVYGNASPESLTIQTLCAVVDKLPASRTFKPGASLNDEISRCVIEPPVGETGFEGIAFATFPATASVPSTSPRSPDKGAIDFMFSKTTKNDTTYHDTWRLPLANTVFQTGSLATIYLSQWSLSRDGNLPKLEEKINISHHGIKISTNNGETNQETSALAIPLVPLGMPRRVEGCMGNIIRRLIINKESAPASSELETVVPKYFESRGELAQPTTVWALVIPAPNVNPRATRRLLSKKLNKKEKGTDMRQWLWDRVWKSDPVAWNNIVPKAIIQKAHLHRVLSGGGGWGKKAGLLSLDPVPVSDEVPIRMEDATSTFDGPGDFSTALMPVVESGDYVQFFISPNSGIHAETEEQNKLEILQSLKKKPAWGWELGTVPSTVDSIPGGSWQDARSGSKYVAVFKNSFGALTEGGLTLSQHLQKKGGLVTSRVYTTTVDVPYSRFWAVEAADKKHLIQDSMDSRQNTADRQLVIRRIKKNWSHHFVGPKSVEATAESVRILGKEIARLKALCQTIVFQVRYRVHEKYIVPSRRAREEQQYQWSRILAKSQRVIDELEKQIQCIPKDRIHLRVAWMQQQEQRLQASILAIEKELRRSDKSINQYMRFINAANKSAIRVYNLHTALRLRLGKLIFYRLRTKKDKSRLQLLFKSHLIDLRAYDEVLFCNAQAVLPSQIGARLYQLENESFIQGLVSVKTPQPPIRTHVTFDREALDWRMKGALDVQEPIVREVLSKTRRKKALSPAAERKKRREEFVNTVASWLGGSLG